MLSARFLSLFLAAWALVLLLSPGTNPAFAQGNGQNDGIVGPVRIDRQVTVGPYSLFVEAEASNLSLGTALISVAVLEDATGEPAPEARVVIHTRHEITGETGWASALGLPEHPEIYRARMKLDEPGPWAVNIEVDGPLGRVETRVGTVTIPEPRQYWVGSVVFGGMSVLLFCGVAYVIWTIRRTQKRREAANAV